MKILGRALTIFLAEGPWGKTLWVGFELTYMAETPVKGFDGIATVTQDCLAK